MKILPAFTTFIITACLALVACKPLPNVIKTETKALKNGEVTGCTHGLNNGNLTYIVFQNAKGSLINQVHGSTYVSSNGVIVGLQWLKTRKGKKILLPSSMKVFQITATNIMECKLNINLQQLESYLGGGVSNYTISNMYAFLHMTMPKIHSYE